MLEHLETTLKTTKITDGVLHTARSLFTKALWFWLSAENRFARRRHTRSGLLYVKSIVFISTQVTNTIYVYNALGMLMKVSHMF